ncbi:hypothetical protein AMECASPLE_026554, partial [Ameca splendens]
VRGWARVSPMSCILMNQKNQDKAKHEEADNPATLVLNRTLSKAGSKASLVEQYCKFHAGLPNIKEAGSMDHHAGPWGPTEWPVHNTTQKYLPGSFFEGKMEKKGMLRETTSSPSHLSSQSSLSGSRALKAQKHTIRDVTVVPIKNLTFLPPIISPQTKPKVNTHVCRGKKTPDAKIFHKPEKRIGVSRTQLDIAAYSDLPLVSTAPTVSHQACQQNPHLFPAVGVSVSRRQPSISLKPDTLDPTRYSLDNNMSQAMVQPLVPARCLFT